MADTRLFRPMRIGDMQISHRIAMAPLTRLRATDDRVPTALMREYYSQRASVPGTLIISEGTFVGPNAAGFPNAPGLWTEEQVDGWRSVTREVHRRGGHMVSQLFAMGRAGDPETAAREGSEIVGPSAVPIADGYPVPRPLTTDEVRRGLVGEFVAAAENAVRAGFDAVEIHGAQGYLLDQFLQDVSNTRDDDYGGSVENRSRLIAEVVGAVAAAIGPHRVGLRLSPWNTFQGMRMEDPVPQFTDLIRRVSATGIAYLHVIESRVAGAEDTDGSESLDFIYDLWKGPLLVAGGFTPQKAAKLVDEEHPDRDIVVVFGRQFISNPDLVYRIQKGLALTAYDRNTFYIPQSPSGYSDYPFSKEYIESASANA